MTDDQIYTIRRTVRTYADLLTGAEALLSKAKVDRDAAYWLTMGSLTLVAFTFEAYLNHMGAMRIKFWEEIESIKVLQKFRVLCQDLGYEPEFSRRPCQTLRDVFRFRNAIAHGRSEVIEETGESTTQRPFPNAAPKTFREEYCVEENAKKAVEDVLSIIRELDSKAGVPNLPFRTISTTFGFTQSRDPDE